MVVVGSAGRIGQRHIQDILDMATARLVGVHDVDTEVARAQAEEHGVSFYQTLEDALVDPNVGAITVATPHPLHHTIALQAFQAGKHVLTEKPMAATLSQADEMIAGAQKAGVTLGVVFQHRFRPEVAKMHELLEAGELGRLYRTMLVQSSFRPQYYYDASSWLGTWAQAGSGALLTQAVHFIDLFVWLGGMPRVVHGMAGTLAHQIEVEDSVSAMLEYDDGAQGLMHCDTIQPPTQEQLELWGERGGLALRDDQLTHHRTDMSVPEFFKRERTDRFGQLGSNEVPTGVKPLHGHSGRHQDTIEDFAQALIDGREPAVPGEEGIKSLELIAAILLSSCRGRPIRLPVDRSEYNELLEELAARRQLTRPEISAPR
jgi:predicted dehydrogenase